MEIAAYSSLTLTVTDISYFEVHNFISPLVMEYLGIRSLVRFSATTKRHLKCMDMEVDHRQKQFTECKEEFTTLLDQWFHSRADITRAYSIRNKVNRMIDSELDWLNDRRRTQTKNKIFFEERKDFHEGFKIFPDCFYIPPEGELRKPNEEEIDIAYNAARWLMSAECSHMNFFYEFEEYKLKYHDPQYPFRKLLD